MNQFNFKSAVCTSRSQSKRLLALGIKPETADMCYKVTTHDFKGNEINEKDRHYTLCCWYDESSLVCGLERKETIPAWSLHRLLCLYGADYTIKEVYNNAEECYGMLICAIEIAIEDGDFNEEYLEKQWE